MIDPISILSKLDDMKKSFGIFGLIIILTIAIFIFLAWKYLNRRTELIAENACEKSLKKFQFQIDKDLEKYKTVHQKQVDSIHEIFQKFQLMASLINFILKGENFTQPMSVDEEISHLIKFRHDFKNIYHQNRLLLSRTLCSKIDSLIPAIDSFIQTYESGLFPENSSGYEDDPEGYHIAGIWRQDAFDEPLKQLDIISNEIEFEFRKIYGTDQ
jgi:uncharacterized membrane protein